MFDIDELEKDVFFLMEGADEPEWSLYNTIYTAITLYKRRESGHVVCNPYELTHSCIKDGICDRNKLLKLADMLESEYRRLCQFMEENPVDEWCGWEPVLAQQDDYVSSMIKDACNPPLFTPIEL